MSASARGRLAETLDARRDDGCRSTVPVFGDGLNLQAFAEARRKRRPPWTAAIEAITGRLDPALRRRIRRWPSSHQGRFDALDDAFAAPKNYDEPSEFQELLGSELMSRLELGSGLELYSTIAVAGFATIVTTNIDETFPVATGFKRRPPPGIYYDDELYRKSVMRLGTRARPTDLWQMHGSASMPGGIRLGIANHAATIAELEMFRIQLLNAWPRGPGGLDPPAAYSAMHGPLVFNWFKTFMVEPLVFVGSSLDPSDWPLWWLLHQRYRVFAVFEPRHRPPTYALTASTEPLPHLAHSPAGVEQIEFATFDELWAFLRGALTA